MKKKCWFFTLVDKKHRQFSCWLECYQSAWSDDLHEMPEVIALSDGSAFYIVTHVSYTLCTYARVFRKVFKISNHALFVLLSKFCYFTTSCLKSRKEISFKIVSTTSVCVCVCPSLKWWLYYFLIEIWSPMDSAKKLFNDLKSIRFSDKIQRW